MGFFSSKDKQIQGTEDTNDEQLTNYSKGQKILLQDTEPRFKESEQQIQNVSNETALKEAVRTIKWQDFSAESLTGIPCFRDAGMVGFSSMFILGSVTLLYHKNPTKAVNWSMCGLLLGSIVGWEQCRLMRKNSFKNAELAKAVVRNKPKPMLHNNNLSPEEVEELQKKATQRLLPENGSSSSTPFWKKFW